MAKKTNRVVANKCRLEYSDLGFEIVELDKEMCAVNSIDFRDFVNDFIDVDGISITISHDSEF